MLQVKFRKKVDNIFNVDYYIHKITICNYKEVIHIRYWLKKIREETCFTSYEIAKQLNMGQSTYIAVELGTRNPSVKTAKKIAQYFGFDWTKFFEEREKAV